MEVAKPALPFPLVLDSLCLHLFLGTGVERLNYASMLTMTSFLILFLFSGFLFSFGF